jgi:peptide-methionine (R)-S-oxide reductase
MNKPGTTPAASRRTLIAAGAVALCGYALWRSAGPAAPLATAEAADAEKFEVMHTDEEWKKLLTPTQYNILRQEGTERPYSSPLNDEHRTGSFACAACNRELFTSKTKFDSGTGWPSFWTPLDHAVIEHRDTLFGMLRTEVKCQRCGGHLGHVFNDGPKPTGLRYCMNGFAMNFKAAEG